MPGLATLPARNGYTVTARLTVGGREVETKNADGETVSVTFMSDAAYEALRRSMAECGA